MTDMPESTPITEDQVQLIIITEDVKQICMLSLSRESEAMGQCLANLFEVRDDIDPMFRLTMVVTLLGAITGLLLPMMTNEDDSEADRLRQIEKWLDDVGITAVGGLL